MEDWWMRVWSAVQPVDDPEISAPVLTGVLLGVLLVVALPGVWRWARVLVTVVHELGHAVVGVLAGRRFTGLVLRADMSGHAVTVGAPRGVGRVLTTWAGYPAPGVLGAGLLHLGVQGWGPPVLGAGTVVLALALLRARSLYTVVVMGGVTVLSGALWWAGPPEVQVLVLVGAGCFLLLGAWRHLGAVVAAGRGERGSDPGVLARLTRVPALLWNLSFGVVLGLASWLSAQRLLELGSL